MVRFKNRYMTVQIDPVDKQVPALSLKTGSLYTSIVNMVQQIHGDFGVAAVRSGLAAKYCNEHTRIAVIRVRHGPHNLVASCLPLVAEVEKRKVRVHILYTGATLRQCYRFIKVEEQNIWISERQNPGWVIRPMPDMRMREVDGRMKRYQMSELEKLWTSLKGDANRREEMQKAFMDFGALEHLEPMTSF